VNVKDAPAFPEPIPWIGDDPGPAPWERGEDTVDVESCVERDWADLEATAREFVAVYGVAAMLRCVSRAVEGKGAGHDYR
jgi:hypothetical protein